MDPGSKGIRILHFSSTGRIAPDALMGHGGYRHTKDIPRVLF